jgi:hypothetical protein
MVEFSNVIEESLTWAIRKIIETPKYFTHLHCSYYYYYYHHYCYLITLSVLFSVILLLLLKYFIFKPSVYWILRSMFLRQIVSRFTCTLRMI